MRILHTFGAILLIACGACSKQDPAPVTPSAENAPTSPSPGQAQESVPPPPGSTENPSATPEAAPTTGDTNSTAGPEEGVTPENFNTQLIGLQSAVDQYIQDQKRNPSSFQEIIKAGYLEQVPPPPKGKKFVIDPKSFQVKEVNL